MLWLSRFEAVGAAFFSFRERRKMKNAMAATRRAPPTETPTAMPIVVLLDLCEVDASETGEWVEVAEEPVDEGVEVAGGGPEVSLGLRRLFVVSLLFFETLLQ